MAKQQLNERFQELAGIKPLAHLKEDNIKEQMMNRMEANPVMKESVLGALAGVAGVLGMAGATSALESMMDDPDFQAKYPKAAEILQKIFGGLTAVANDLNKGGAGPKY